MSFLARQITGLQSLFSPFASGCLLPECNVLAQGVPLLTPRLVSEEWAWQWIHVSRLKITSYLTAWFLRQSRIACEMPCTPQTGSFLPRWQGCQRSGVGIASVYEISNIFRDPKFIKLEWSDRSLEVSEYSKISVRRKLAHVERRPR